MVNTKTQLVNKTNHDTAAKLEAVRKVGRLMQTGLTKNAALKIVAKPLNRTPQSVQNWIDKCEDLTTLTNNTPLVQSTVLHNNHTGRFTVRSVDLRTTDGVNIRLAFEDMKQIARIAGFTN